jgi:hypothetical protein
LNTLQLTGKMKLSTIIYLIFSIILSGITQFSAANYCCSNECYYTPPECYGKRSVILENIKFNAINSTIDAN